MLYRRIVVRYTCIVLKRGFDVFVCECVCARACFGLYDWFSLRGCAVENFPLYVGPHVGQDTFNKLFIFLKFNIVEKRFSSSYDGVVW